MTTREPQKNIVWEVVHIHLLKQSKQVNEVARSLGSEYI